MKTLALPVTIVALGLLGTPSSAQPAPPPPPPPRAVPMPPPQPYGHPPPQPAPAPKKEGRVEITPFYGYQWWGAIEVADGELDIENSPVYGGVINIQTGGTGRANSMIELMYSRQDTQLNLDSGLGGSQRLFDIAVEHYQIGGVGEIVQAAGGDTKVVPFTVGTLGFTRYAPKSSSVDDEYNFSITFGMGVKVKINKHVGLRFHGRIISTFVDSGSQYFCGPNGCAVSLSAWSVFQSELSGALVIAL